MSVKGISSTEVLFSELPSYIVRVCVRVRACVVETINDSLWIAVEFRVLELQDYDTII